MRLFAPPSPRLDAASSRLLPGVAAHLLSLTLLLSDGPLPALHPLPAHAAPFTEEQKLSAEAWKVTDKEFVDRTFGGQDWFMTRTKLLKETKKTTRDETYDQIRAMLKSLDDKYTRFLTPAMYGAIYATATGDVAGVGCELAAEPRADGKEGTEVVFSNIFEGSPAEKAGLMSGDVLVGVDSDPLPVSLSAEETSAKVRGPAGSKVRLSVRRRAAAVDAEPETLIIERGKVKIDAVSSQLLAGKVGLIKVRNFSTSTAEDVKKALTEFTSEGVSKLVIDLRGNTGGYFPGGVDVARLLLPKDAFITNVIDYKGNELSYQTYEDGLDTATPLFVLVDEKTASASEILASALQDNGRAQLVGTQTFGKAVIQNVAKLADDSAVVVTTARYESPKKRPINQVGITPDLKRDGGECAKGTAPLDCLGKV